ASIGLRDRRPSPAELADALPEALVIGRLALQHLARGAEGPTLVEEPRCLIAEHALIVGEIEVHGLSRGAGRSRFVAARSAGGTWIVSILTRASPARQPCKAGARGGARAGRPLLSRPCDWPHSAFSRPSGCSRRRHPPARKRRSRPCRNRSW